LDKIASGGELALFMLALKVVLAGSQERAALIFDEVDAGISGATANAVGERLARLAKNVQVLVVTGVVVNPRIDGVRSTRDFIADVEKRTTAIAELGWVGAKEQYLLQMRRPSFNFGHARWRERDRELDDAATWLSGDSARALLIDRRNLSACFAQTRQAAIGRANGIDWVLVSGRPDPACVARGNAAAVIAYDPR
jgi:hypothetical protein